MAKMHTKSKGKSKSRKPIVEKGVIPEGFPLTKEQVEKLIADYSKQGIKPAMIGELLKKEHGVLNVEQITGKRLMQVLKEHKLAGDIPPDMMDLMAKAVNLRHHLGRNKKDMSNSLRLKRIESKIWRLTRYYIQSGALPGTWRYDPQQAELLIKGRA